MKRKVARSVDPKGANKTTGAAPANINMTSKRKRHGDVQDEERAFRI